MGEKPLTARDLAGWRYTCLQHGWMSNRVPCPDGDGSDNGTPWDTDAYACAVVNLLAREFPDLGEEVAAGIVRKYVYASARAGDGAEVILDNPFTANWRLVLRDRRIRVSCWRLNPSAADRERQKRLNAALDALEVSCPPSAS